MARSRFIRAERLRNQNVVLYKRGEAALPIELALPLTVALGRFGMRAPVALLIIGMLGPPLLPAVDDHLGVHRVGFNLVPVVIGAATTLALRLAANALLESVRGGVKASLAIRTAVGRGQRNSSEIGKSSNL